MDSTSCFYFRNSRLSGNFVSTLDYSEALMFIMASRIVVLLAGKQPCRSKVQILVLADTVLCTDQTGSIVTIRILKLCATADYAVDWYIQGYTLNATVGKKVRRPWHAAETPQRPNTMSKTLMFHQTLALSSPLSLLVLILLFSSSRSRSPGLGSTASTRLEPARPARLRTTPRPRR